MVDADVRHRKKVEHVMDELGTARREINEVRWANKTLMSDFAALESTRTCRTSCPTCSVESVASQSGKTASLQEQESTESGSMYAPLLRPPHAQLAPSTSAVPVWSPTRPIFSQISVGPSGSQVLSKTVSQPILMP